MTASTFTLRPVHPKGKCKDCAAEGLDVAAWDGRATRCVRHLTPRERAKHGIPEPAGGSTTTATTQETTTQFRVERPTAATNGDTPPPGINPDVKLPLSDDEKDQQVNQLAAELLKLNPQIVRGFAWACDPIPPSNFYTVDAQTGNMAVQPRGQLVMVKPQEAKIIARALVEAQEAPQFKAVNKVVNTAVKPYLPFVSLIGALGVIGWHGFQMVKLRDDMRHAWIVQQQQGDAGADSSSSAAEADTRPSTAADDVTTATDEDGEPVEIRDLGNLADMRHIA